MNDATRKRDTETYTMYPDASFFHTWRRPSPAARSKTLNSSLSEQTAALHLWWASGHQPPHPPTHQTARTESHREETQLVQIKPHFISIRIRLWC